MSHSPKSLKEMTLAELFRLGIQKALTQTLSIPVPGRLSGGSPVVIANDYTLEEIQDEFNRRPEAA